MAAWPNVSRSQTGGAFGTGFQLVVANARLDYCPIAKRVSSDKAQSLPARKRRSGGFCLCSLRVYLGRGCWILFCRLTSCFKECGLNHLIFVHWYGFLIHAILGTEQSASPSTIKQTEHWSVTSKQSGFARIKSFKLSTRASAPPGRARLPRG